jgi:hypothetical protein
VGDYGGWASLLVVGAVAGDHGRHRWRRELTMTARSSRGGLCVNRRSTARILARQSTAVQLLVRQRRAEPLETAPDLTGASSSNASSNRGDRTGPQETRQASKSAGQATHLNDRKELRIKRLGVRIPPSAHNRRSGGYERPIGPLFTCPAEDQKVRAALAGTAVTCGSAGRSLLGPRQKLPTAMRYQAWSERGRTSFQQPLPATLMAHCVISAFTDAVAACGDGDHAAPPEIPGSPTASGK